MISTTQILSIQILSIQIENNLKARGLIKVGLAMQRLYLWNIAMDCFSKALQQLKFADLPLTHPNMLLTAKCIDTATLRPMFLVPKESPHRLVLKYGATLRASTMPSGVPLELISHPGHSIVPMTPDYGVFTTRDSYCFLGIGTCTSSMLVHYDGDFIIRVDDGFVFNVCAGWLHEGVALVLKPGPQNERERKKQLTMSNGSRRFLINDDGTISVTISPDLVLGMSVYPLLYLVDRYSSNRAIFKNIDQISHPVNASSNIEDYDGIKLELESHASYGVVPISKLVTIKNKLHLAFRVLGLGPAEDSLKLIYHKNKIIIRNHDNYLLCLHFPGHFAGNSIDMIGSTLPNYIELWYFKILNKWIANKYTDFSVNSDGTISPLNAPHLVLGFQIPDFSNQQQMPVIPHIQDPLKDDGHARRSNITGILLAFIIKVLNGT